jgi:hypothetical protein
MESWFWVFTTKRKFKVRALNKWAAIAKVMAVPGVSGYVTGCYGVTAK